MINVGLSKSLFDNVKTCPLTGRGMPRPYGLQNCIRRGEPCVRPVTNKFKYNFTEYVIKSPLKGLGKPNPYGCDFLNRRGGACLAQLANRMEAKNHV